MCICTSPTSSQIFLLFLFCSRRKSLSLLVSARRNIVVFQFLLSRVCRSLPKYFISLKLSFSLLLFFLSLFASRAKIFLEITKYASTLDELHDGTELKMESRRSRDEAMWERRNRWEHRKHWTMFYVSIKFTGCFEECYCWARRKQMIAGMSQRDRDLKNIDNKRSSQSLAHQPNDQVIDPPRQKSAFENDFFYRQKIKIARE